MSTSKHIDKICIAAISLTLVMTILFMCGDSLGIAASARQMKYENTLFDASYVHIIDIVMDDWDAFIESCENEEYASCTVLIDGTKHGNTAIRAKGNTSLAGVRSAGSQRYSFKLEFDHYEDGKSCDGLDKLCLNNLIQDNTMMKDYIVYQLMNDFGVCSPLCSFAYITVNGEDWGLYLAVEGVEDSFLARNYGSDTGELYKPDSMSFGGGRGNGRNFNMDDFGFDSESSEGNLPEMSPEQPNGTVPQIPEGEGQQGTIPKIPGLNGQQGSMPQMPADGDQQNAAPQLPDNREFDFTQIPNTDTRQFDFMRTQGGSGMGSSDVKLQYIDDDPSSYPNIFDNAKTDISSDDEERLISSLRSLSEYNNIENVLDTEKVLRYFVVHNFVCNGDSYTGNMIHNYYLHEKNGSLSMIPWDYNLAFGSFQGGNASSEVNADIDEVLSDRPMQAWIFCDEQYTARYYELYCEFMDKWFTNGEFLSMIEKTAELVRPFVEKDPTKFCSLEDFDKGIKALSEFADLRACAVTRQLAGDEKKVDTGSLNLSDMGTMGGLGGGKNRAAEFSSNLNAAEKKGEEPDTSEKKSAFAKGTNRNEGQQWESGTSDNTGLPSRGLNMSDKSPKASEWTQWICIAVSAAVLALGLLIAGRKKF